MMPGPAEETDMTSLAYRRSGAGEPLVLLHALGSSHEVWEPVAPALARHFDVIAVDLPGFGGSAPLPGEPSPAALAAAVAGLLDELGVTAPHVAGNSLGGWVAMELARLRPLASVTLLSPAGLWRGSTPRYCRISLRATRWLARHANRSAVLAGPVPGRAGAGPRPDARPARPSDRRDAQAAIRTLGTARDTTPFCGPRFTAGSWATEPVARRSRWRSAHGTGFCPRQARHTDQLPRGTRIESLPGCGHLPMSDDPDAVSALIIRSAAGSAAGGPRVCPQSRRFSS